MRHALVRIAIAAIAIGLPASIATARADEADAKRLFQAMSDYLGKQQSISFDYDSNLEFVTDDNQKLGLASSGSLALSRPDKVRATRTGGFADVALTFDGRLLTLLVKNADAYAQLEVPGTIDQLVDELRNKYGRPMPAADLLMSDVYAQLMPTVIDTKDLGSGVIHGVECDHLAFRTADVDWQIWIAQGERHYPCRYVITSKEVDQAPEFVMTIRDWKAGGAAAPSDFTFTPPAGATKMDIKDLQALKDTSDLPENYKIGAAK